MNSICYTSRHHLDAPWTCRSQEQQPCFCPVCELILSLKPQFHRLVLKWPVAVSVIKNPEDICKIHVCLNNYLYRYMYYLKIRLSIFGCIHVDVYLYVKISHVQFFSLTIMRVKKNSKLIKSCKQIVVQIITLFFRQFIS